MAESLRNKTLRGTIWSSLERFSVQGVQFVVMIIMARFLTPDDYGLVGMLTIFIAVSQSLVDSGFSQALIRKRDRNIVDDSTVFFFNIIVAVGIYALIFVAAPAIARFYDQPALTTLTRIVSLSIILNSLVVVQVAILTINVDFKTLAKVSMISAIVSGVIGIVMAYCGSGYWSIVVQQLSNLLIYAVIMWIISPWRPIKAFSKNSFKEMFGFGSKLAISGIIDTTYRNIYLVVIGKVFNASDLGYYTRAHQFASFPSSNLTSVLQRVTYPILCSIQDDQDRLKAAYSQLLKVSAFVIFPLMTALSALSKPLISILLTPSWAFTSTLLSLLCWAMMWYPIHAINLNVLTVEGRSDLFLKLEIIKKVIGVTILCITIPFGLIWMCAGQIVNSLISLVINTHYTKILIGIGFFKQIKAILPSLLYSTSLWVIVVISTSIIPSNWLKLLIGSFISIFWYLGLAKLCKANELEYIKAIIKRYKK